MASSLSPPPKFQDPNLGGAPKTPADWVAFLRWLFSLYRVAASSITAPQSITIAPQPSPNVSPDLILGAAQALARPPVSPGQSVVIPAPSSPPPARPDDLSGLVQYALSRPPYSQRPGGGYILVGTRAARVALDPVAYAAYEFYETDTTLVYVSTGVHWQWVAGRWRRVQSTIAALVATLGTDDAGLQIDVTDYAHVLRWSGVALAWDNPDDYSGYIAGFLVDPLLVGWQLCDGTAAVPYLKMDGTIGTVNLPDLTSSGAAAAYLKFGSPASAVKNLPVQPVFSGYPQTWFTLKATLNAGGQDFVVSPNPYTPAGLIGNTGEPQNLVLRPWFRQ